MKVSMEVKVSKQLTDLLKNVKKPIDRETAKLAGEETIKAMKKQIASGVSPIKGNGKFQAYKNPKKYPGSQKPRSPVDLKLTGDFLDALTSNVVTVDSGYGVELSYSGKQEIKEKGHREGANGQPKRPTLPAGEGEDFSPNIKLIYLEIFKQRILNVLNGKD